MSKGGKLAKLKSVLKKMQSFKIGRANGSPVVANDHDHDCFYQDDEDMNNLTTYTVYVGKSRRRYLVNSDVINHPLFRELVERSGKNADVDSFIVGCEVVLFEHMLWMLINADPQPEPLNELVEFYAS